MAITNASWIPEDWAPQRRPTGTYGRLPAVMPVGLRDLTWYVAGSLPKPPAVVAVPDGVSWGMLGNDQYGDCGVAGFSHGAMAVAADLKSTVPPALASADDIVKYYLKYTRNKDTGVVLSNFLAYIKKTGFLGYKIDAYAPVSVSDIPTLQFVIDAYDFAYVGITVTQAMEEKFSQHLPWTLDVLSSPVAGGHCVVLVGYDSNYLYAVTWGGIQAIPYSTWAHIADESWAIIPTVMDAAKRGGHGVAIDAIQADLKLLAR
jgi:hypothetical protein